MSRSRIRLAVVLAIAVPLLGYPALVLADGAVFPSRDDCVQVAPEGATGALDLVFGRRDTVAAAEALRERVAAVGYVDAEVRLDGCGRWRVLYDGIESYAQGASSRGEARAAGLRAELELEPPG